MATIIKKQIGATTRYALKFDQPPSMTELRQAINSIDLADRTMRLKKISRDDGTSLQEPVRFVFIAEGETETDVPVV